MSRKYVYVLLTILVTAALWYAEREVDKRNQSVFNKGDETIAASEEFQHSMLPTSTTGVIVHHNFYSLSYVEKYEQAEWVAYELKKDQLVNIDRKRPYFVEDLAVKSKSADWKNYKNSGYDRGHLCPAGDRRFSNEAYEETFLTSNISPQNREFNSGIWNRLEQKTRRWAKKYGGVYVVTGGILKDGLKGIGYENVSVPDEFYKIVVDASKEKYKAIAFIIPNKETSESYFDYTVSIDEIEAKTGIDFFPQLPDSIENEMESLKSNKGWK